MSNTSQVGRSLVGYSDLALVDTFPTAGTIEGVATVATPRSVITGGSVPGSIGGMFTVPSPRSVFGGGAVLPRSTGVTVFVAGVDRTSYIGQQYKGAVINGSTSVGSTGNCVLPINNVSPAGAFLSPWTPTKFEDVQLYLGTYRVFGGVVNTVEQTMYSDDNGVKIYALNCWSYGAILDRTFVGTHFEIYNGALANIIMYNLVSRYLTAQWGITWGGSGGDSGPFFPPFSINWWSFTQINQYICSAANWSAYVDQYKVLRMFGIASTARPAPFTISKANSKYETLKPTRGGEYFNYVIVRNSQNLGSIWHDTFAGDADGGLGFYAPLTAALTVKPAVYVDTGSGYVAQVVTDPGVYGQPWDFYWLPFGVQRNSALSPLGSSDSVKVAYPLDIDRPTFALDAGEIATYGPVMKMVEIKDITTLANMQSIADGELAKGIENITSLETQTDTPGLEPGQIAVVNAEDISSENFMLESVGFTQIAPETFRFTAKGSNANVQRRNDGPALFQRLLAQATQARDRIQTPVVFNLFTTVVGGGSNPGSTTGVIPGAIRTLPVSGVLVKWTLNFQSVSTTPTTVDVIINALIDGVSIYPAGDPAKMIFPAGATTPQTGFIFLTDPQEVTAGSVVTLDCLQADPNAFDGVLELTIQG